METKLNDLKLRLAEISDLGAANSVLAWDQQTYMPPGGAEARGRQMSILGRLAHEKSTAPELGQLLDDLRSYEASQPFDSFDASLIRVARRDYERWAKIPSDLVAQMYTQTAHSYQAWVAARPANDFAAVEPHLERMLDLSRQVADCFPGYAHIADPLIDFNDYGVQAETVRSLFAQLRSELVPMVQAITSQPPADDAFLHQNFPVERQLAFGKHVIERFGYDFARGRQDESPHPFMIRFSTGDVRITTRIKPDDLSEALFSTMHESGHAMYEQGVNQHYEGTPLAGGTSAGVHESQSRLWENLVGRSRSFWEHFYPEIRGVFPNQLADVSLDAFYRAINKVQRSLVRTDADEVTYNLHVMLRFDLELDLLDGSLAVRDLPEAWNARYRDDLGVTPPDQRDGVLQDVHWYDGLIGGAFQGYTLGNILSAQFFNAATKAAPEIAAEIGQGEFGTLHGWLADNVYQWGSMFTAPELVERATGEALTIAPYVAYLKQKYGELYSL